MLDEVFDRLGPERHEVPCAAQLPDADGDDYAEWLGLNLHTSSTCKIPVAVEA